MDILIGLVFVVVVGVVMLKRVKPDLYAKLRAKLPL
jgi:hypothetical protein